MRTRPGGPGIRELSSYLLEVHRRSHALGHREMLRFALESLRALVPFDGALAAVGTVQHGVATAHEALLLDRPPELMASWAEVKDEDRLAFAATSRPGTTVSISASGPMYDDAPRVRAHCARFDIEHLMCTAHVYAEAGLYWVMSLYRSAASPAFSEEERVTNELVSPHLFAASRNARISELRALAKAGGAHGTVVAITSAAGLVLEADEGLVEALRVEWPRWRGPLLPPALGSALPDLAGRWVGKRVVVRVDPAGAARIVNVRPRTAADDLTPREREITEAFALGESHREIGARLAIAPATVRRHLANVYEKLGVSSKAELDRMLRASD